MVQRPYLIQRPPTTWNMFDEIPRLPRNAAKGVLLLESDALRKADVQTGIYSGWKTIKPVVYPILDFLCDELETRLSKLNAHQVIAALYTILEQFYGAQDKRDHHLNVQRVLNPDSSNQMTTHSQPAEALEALGVRYAIENALKFGSVKGKRPTQADLDTIWAISARVLHLDQFLEHVFLGMIEHQAVVTTEFQLGLGVTAAGDDAFRRFQNEYGKIWHEREAKKILEIHANAFKWTPESELTDSDNWQRFDSAFQEELGYTLSAWWEVVKVLISMFGPDDFLLDLDRRTVIQRLRRMTGFKRDKVELILDDILLTKGRMLARSRRQLLPAESFWRDERLTSRPVIQVDRRSERRIVLGIEVITKSMLLTFQRLNGGHPVFLGRTTHTGAIAKVAGRINESSGDQLRDFIREQLERRGYQIESEKKSIRGVIGTCPAGPIDLFVVDQRSSRLVLVEVKDLSLKLTPSEWKWERDEFQRESDPIGFLRRLDLKRQWFDSHKAELRKESGADSAALIDAVIVTGFPSMWVFTNTESQPVIHFDEFLTKLADGLPLRSKPLRWQ